jgi:hypothetical protein
LREETFRAHCAEALSERAGNARRRQAAAMEEQGEGQGEGEGALTTVITIDGVSATVDHKSNQVTSEDATLRDRVRRVLENIRFAMLIEVGC